MASVRRCIIGETPARLASRAAAVVEQQLDPAELLRKYEWFKEAAAALDKKQADVKVYDARRLAMAKGYEGVPRQDWPRDDREQYNLWESEVAGIKASYNALAAEYNASMAKVNWRFCNVGQLPRGAETPLPREFKPYIEQ